MSKCTAGQAVSAFAYWLDYYEKASSAYASTRAKTAFDKNKGSNNYTYAGYLCGVQGQPWCAAQVTTAIYEACDSSRAEAKEIMHGVWPYVNCAQMWDAADYDHKFWGDYQRFTLGKGNRTRYTPVPGDVIVFTDNKVVRSHTGMVYAADDTYVYTYEGNSGNMCRKRSYRRDSSYIYGYVKPLYKTSSDTIVIDPDQYGAEIIVEVKRHVLSKGCAGPEVKELQELLNENGANIKVDGEFGTATEAAVMAYQEKHGLKADGIVGKNTWEMMLA